MGGYNNQNGCDELLQPLKEDECAVYLYLEKLPWPFPAGAVMYSINGKKIGVVNVDSYLYLTNPSGDIKISAYNLSISTKYLRWGTALCQSYQKKDTSWTTGADLAPVTVSEGEKKIQVRHPALHE